MKSETLQLVEQLPVLRSVFIVERSANSSTFHCLWVSGTIPGFLFFFLSPLPNPHFVFCINFWLANTFQMSKMIMHIMWSSRWDGWHLSGTRVTRFGQITYTPPRRSCFRFSCQLPRLGPLCKCLNSVSRWIIFVFLLHSFVVVFFLSRTSDNKLLAVKLHCKLAFDCFPQGRKLLCKCL